MRSVLVTNLPCCYSACPSLAWLSLTTLHPKRVKTPSQNPLLSVNRQIGFFRPSLIRLVESVSCSSTMADSTRSVEDSKPLAILFVCLGNICRSPAAEAVFSDIVRRRGLESKFKIDSAGTIGYHEGNPADSRMRAAASKRGINVNSISRPIRPSDFKDFDLILAMDMQNRDDLLSSHVRWCHKEDLPEDAYKKVKLMCSFCKKHSETEVPDPYYGGPQGFEKVLDILEDGCEVLLEKILTDNGQGVLP